MSKKSKLTALGRKSLVKSDKIHTSHLIQLMNIFAPGVLRFPSQSLESCQRLLLALVWLCDVSVLKRTACASDMLEGGWELFRDRTLQFPHWKTTWYKWRSCGILLTCWNVSWLWGEVKMTYNEKKYCNGEVTNKSLSSSTQSINQNAPQSSRHSSPDFFSDKTCTRASPAPSHGDTEQELQDLEHFECVYSLLDTPCEIYDLKKRKKSCNLNEIGFSKLFQLFEFEKCFAVFRSDVLWSKWSTLKQFYCFLSRVWDHDFVVTTCISWSHLIGLDKFGEYLIVWRKVEIHDLFYSLNYIFACSGLDGIPKSLGYMMIYGT